MWLEYCRRVMHFNIVATPGVRKCGYCRVCRKVMHFYMVATPGVRKCGVGGEVGEGSLVPTLNFCMINGAPEIS